MIIIMTKSTKKKSVAKVVKIARQARSAKSAKKAIRRLRGPAGKQLVGRGSYSLADLGRDIMKPVAYTQDKSTVGKIARSIGNVIGDATGIPGAGPILGNASSWFSSLFGFGKYDVRKNSLLQHARNLEAGLTTESGFATNGPPLFKNGKFGSDLVLAKREYIQDVYGSSAFNATSILLNPGNPALCGWLEPIAAQYEQYEFLGMVFEFKSLCATSVSTAGGTTPVLGLGTVIMATDYDCLDNAYTNKRQMDNAEYSVDGAPYDNLMHPIECAPGRQVVKRNYVVPGVQTLSQLQSNSVTTAGISADPRMDYPGTFYIATQGQPANANTPIGELWVTYHIRLSRPILENAITVNYSQSRTFSIAAAASTTVSNAPIDVFPTDPMVGFQITGGVGPYPGGSATTFPYIQLTSTGAYPMTLNPGFAYEIGVDWSFNNSLVTSFVLPNAASNILPIVAGQATDWVYPYVFNTSISSTTATTICNQLSSVVVPSSGNHNVTRVIIRPGSVPSLVQLWCPLLYTGTANAPNFVMANVTITQLQVYRPNPSYELNRRNDRFIDPIENKINSQAGAPPGGLSFSSSSAAVSTKIDQVDDDDSDDDWQAADPEELKKAWEYMQMFKRTIRESPDPQLLNQPPDVKGNNT